jgi:hypothetical protein
MSAGFREVIGQGCDFLKGEKLEKRKSGEVGSQDVKK